VFFQQKCFDRIRDFRDQGTTLLFVSHVMGAVYALCDKAVLLHGGKVVLQGSPKEVIDLYNAQVVIARGSTVPRVREHAISGSPDAAVGVIPETAGPQARAPGPTDFDAGGVGSYFSNGVKIESVQLLCDGVEVAALVAESLLTVRVRLCFRRRYPDPHVGFQLKNSRGEPLFMTTTAGLRHKIGGVEAGSRAEVDFTFRAALAEGDYTVTAGVADGAAPEGRFRTALARVQDAAAVTIVRNVDAPRWAGSFNLAPDCAVRRLADAPMPAGAQ